MIQKIISGGESGVEQAASDIAAKLDIPGGGWISSWQKQELGAKADKYRLKEMPNITHSRIAEHNVRDAEGVLIIAKGELSGNSALYRRIARQFNIPCRYIDLNNTSYSQAVEEISSWISEFKIRILYITGLKESEDVTIYDAAYDILETVFIMLMAAAPPQGELSSFFHLPKDLEEAAEMLAEKLTFREKTKIANSKKEKLLPLALSLRTYIRSEFRLDTNDALMELCRKITGSDDMDDVILLIVERMWEKLQKANVLRIVKR